MNESKECISNIFEDLKIAQDDNINKVNEKLDNIEKWKSLFANASNIKTRKGFIEHVNKEYNPKKAAIPKYEECDEEKFVAFIKDILPMVVED